MSTWGERGDPWRVCRVDQHMGMGSSPSRTSGRQGGDGATETAGLTPFQSIPHHRPIRRVSWEADGGAGGTRQREAGALSQATHGEAGAGDRQGPWNGESGPLCAVFLRAAGTQDAPQTELIISAPAWLPQPPGALLPSHLFFPRLPIQPVRKRRQTLIQLPADMAHSLHRSVISNPDIVFLAC